MEQSEFTVLIGLKWSLEHAIAHTAAMFFRQKWGRGKRKKKKYNWRKEKKWKKKARRREMRRWETVHMTKMVRHRRATVLAADAVRGRSKICRKGGESISELKGKHCSHRLQQYNMPALKEIKEIKRSIWVSRSCERTGTPGKCCKYLHISILRQNSKDCLNLLLCAH